MQIAVAAAHLALGAAAVEQRLAARRLFAQPRFHPVDLLRFEPGIAAFAQNADIGLDQRRHRGAAAALAADLRLFVELHYMRCERQHQRRGEAAGSGDVLQQQRLLEAPHHHDPVERLAFAGPVEGAVRPAHDRPDLQVELRCGAPVQRQFRGTGGAAPRDGGKIGIRVFDRALQLVGAVAGEKHDRDMRLDRLDRPDHAAIRRRLAQKGDDLALRVSHRRRAARRRRCRARGGNGSSDRRRRATAIPAAVRRGGSRCRRTGGLRCCVPAGRNL